MTTRADFMDSVDLIKNKIIELTQERDQLRQRVADLEAQLAEAKDGGWTYIAPGCELPPPGTDEAIWATVQYQDGSTGVLEGYFNRGMVMLRYPPSDVAQTIAWRRWAVPQPAPLRTAANAEEQGT